MKDWIQQSPTKLQGFMKQSGLPERMIEQEGTGVDK
jgi:hypothetical protein